MKNIIRMSILAGVMGLGYACSGSESELSEITSSVHVSRGAEVEATANLETAGTLEAVLKKAHGDNVANINKLTLTGNYNAVDHRFLRDSLAALTELDMEGVTIVGGDSTYTAPNSSYWLYDAEFKLADNTIGQDMFTNLELTKLILPNNIVKIEIAGISRTKLKSLEIPASAVNVGSSFCAINEALEEVKVMANIEELPAYSFANCGNLKIIELSSTITHLGREAFANCVSLTDFSYFKNVTTLDYETFYNCGFTSIEFHEGLTGLSREAFYVCRSLSSVKFSSTITEVGMEAFSLTAIDSLVIPKTVESLPNFCFRNMGSLKYVELLTEIDKIPWECFWGCTNLEEIKLSPTIKSVGPTAFAGCRLKDFKPFENITAIGEKAFRHNQFTSLDLPEGLVEIGLQAFWGNPLTEVTLPSTLTSIRRGAFEDTNISTLTIPESVTSVDGSLINGCGLLTSLFWNTAADLPDASGVNNNCLVYLTNDKVKTNNWKNIILNGYATSIELVASGYFHYSYNSYPFHCPQEFTAKKITYTRDFNLSTSIGGNEGWETIVLPFTPTEYAHAEKGVIAPFDSETDTKKHFWLRGLAEDGFVDVTAMEVNKPYIISMPNCDEYVEEYNLDGTVTFSATEAVIAQTPAALDPVACKEFSLQPVYSKVEESVSIYTLNTRVSVEGYESGSVFKRSLSAVLPFEAYAFYAGRSSSKTIGIGDYTNKSRLVGKKNTSGIPQKEDMGY